MSTKYPFLIYTHGEAFLIQHYVIKFVSYLRQVVGFLCVLIFLHQSSGLKHHKLYGHSSGQIY